MLSPISLPQFRKFLLQFPRRRTFHILNQLAHWRNRYQQMDMITSHTPSDNLRLVRQTNLSDQVSASLRQLPFHYLIPVLRAPDYMVLAVIDPMCRLSVILHTQKPTEVVA